MKPIHEQEWRVRNTNIGPIIDADTHPEGDAVCMVYAPMSIGGERMTLAQSEAIRDERARAIAALPDALRALRMVLEAAEAGQTLDGTETATVRAALRKAGVLHG